jgi:type IV secretory pathway VirB2 component (pilin)
MKRLSVLISTLLIAVASVTILAAPQPALALFQNSRDAACGGVALQDTPATCDASSADTVNNMIRTALEVLSFAAGIAAVIMIIIAGIKFITSQGESANISSARNTVLYAVVGLVVVMLSQFIVRFVLNKASH